MEEVDETMEDLAEVRIWLTRISNILMTLQTSTINMYRHNKKIMLKSVTN